MLTLLTPLGPPHGDCGVIVVVAPVNRSCVLQGTVRWVRYTRGLFGSRNRQIPVFVVFLAEGFLFQKLCLDQLMWLATRMLRAFLIKPLAAM